MQWPFRLLIAPYTGFEKSWSVPCWGCFPCHTGCVCGMLIPRSPVWEIVTQGQGFLDRTSPNITNQRCTATPDILPVVFLDGGQSPEKTFVDQLPMINTDSLNGGGSHRNEPGQVKDLTHQPNATPPMHSAPCRIPALLPSFLSLSLSPSPPPSLHLSPLSYNTSKSSCGTGSQLL